MALKLQLYGRKKCKRNLVRFTLIAKKPITIYYLILGIEMPLSMQL